MGTGELGFLDPRETILRKRLKDSQIPLVHLHLLLRLLQRSNQFIFRNPATNLTNLESMLLIQIDSTDDLTAKALTEIFKVDQSTISRNLKSAESKGYIEQTYLGRSKILRLTKIGKKLLTIHDTHANKIVRSYLARSSKKELDNLALFFRDFCDDLGIPAGKIRNNEHPVRCEMRRIALGLGLTRSENYFSSPLTMLGWHVLSEIFLRGEVSSISHLANTLSIPSLNLTQLISRLDKSGFIQKLPSSGRETIFICSDSGIEALKVVLNNSLKLFCDKLSRSTLLRVEKSLDTIKRLTLSNHLGDKKLGELYFRQFTGKQDLSLARSAIVKWYYKKNRLSDLHHEIAGPSSLVIGVLRNEKIIGIIDSSSSKIIHLASLVPLPEALLQEVVLP